MPRARLLGLVTLLGATLALSRTAPAADPAPPGVVRSEFIYDQASFPQCHASTLAETRGGLVAAWFGGTREGNPDVGIWLSRHEGGRWTAPAEVADGKQDDGKRFPCWNPVLFQSRQGPLLLFYKVGPNPRDWWGVLKTSDDAGKTWSAARRLPDRVWGPIKNKPIELADGSLLCGTSDEIGSWRVFMQRTPDLGRTWSTVGPLNDGKEFGAIQPTLLTFKDGRLLALCRSKQRVITETWSEDGGKTWGPMQASALPNPNSGLDGVTLSDGRHLLVYNHTARGRSPLNVAVSADGKAWRAALTLESEPGEYSYPAVIQTADGRVHTTYTWKRQKIKHVVLEPEKLVLSDLPSGGE